MKRDISAFGGNKFDIVIVGGGITGAFLALDASLRGFSTALVEKGDFGTATSSASSKLLHGGIRYLQEGRIFKVRESAMERAYFQKLAPHLTRWVPFVIPTYKGFRRGSLLLRAGMAAYEAACLGQNGLFQDPGKKVPRGKYLNKGQVAEVVPGMRLEGLTGGILFFESHMHNSERMVLAVLDTASRAGAKVGNYLRADSFMLEGERVVGIRVRDMVADADFEIRASVVVNAAGPWIPQLNATLAERRSTGIVKAFSKGIHLVTRPLTNGCAIALATRKQNQGMINRGGRHVFIIPWRGYSLVGTSYGPYEGDLDALQPLEEDVLELLADVNSALGSEVLRRGDVRSAFAGIYPLTDDHINPLVYQGTGDYQILDHAEKDGIEGLVSVFGAKYTTARLLAEKAINRIARKLLHRRTRCRTRHVPLVSGQITDLAAYRIAMIERFKGLAPAAAIEQLIFNHGAGAPAILELIRGNPALSEPLLPPYEVLAAEVVHAVLQEQAIRLEDVVFRRTGLGTLGHPGRPALCRCADLMGDVLGWDKSRKDEEIRKIEAGFKFLNVASCQT